MPCCAIQNRNLRNPSLLPRRSQSTCCARVRAPPRTTTTKTASSLRDTRPRRKCSGACTVPSRVTIYHDCDAGRELRFRASGLSCDWYCCDEACGLPAFLTHTTLRSSNNGEGEGGLPRCSSMCIGRELTQSQFRRSIKSDGSKHDSAKPVIAIPQKDAIAIEPPKKVYRSHDPRTMRYG